MKMGLEKYWKKRKFFKSPEPKGKIEKKTSDIFVVQKHQARNLHYDFRLAIGGVLKSWAVPKGIPKKTGIKHLAIQVEDHPLEYAKFEGEIPKGEYGAGKVEIWDKGKYKNLEFRMKNKKLIQINFNLMGKRLKGKYVLVKTNFSGAKNSWLIFKVK